MAGRTNDRDLLVLTLARTNKTPALQAIAGEDIFEFSMWTSKALSPSVLVTRLRGRVTFHMRYSLTCSLTSLNIHSSKMSRRISTETSKTADNAPVTQVYRTFSELMF